MKCSYPVKSGHVYSYDGITSCPVCSSHRSSQYKIVGHASQPCLVYRSHRIRSPKNCQEAILARSDAKDGWKEEGSCPVCRPHRSCSRGFFPTHATKYLVWLHTWSSISSADVTRCLSIYRSLLPWQSGAVISHRGKLAQSASVTVRQWASM